MIAAILASGSLSFGIVNVVLSLWCLVLVSKVNTLMKQFPHMSPAQLENAYRNAQIPCKLLFSVCNKHNNGQSRWLANSSSSRHRTSRKDEDGHVNLDGVVSYRRRNSQNTLQSHC